MKKIIFVNPPLPIKNRYGALGQAGGREVPFGLCYLAAVVRQQGFSTAIIDSQTLNIDVDRTSQLVLSHNPGYVGITAATMAITSASELALKIKKYNPRIKVIVGGSHISALPEDTLRDNPFFDIGIVGEGEETLIELLNMLERRLDIGDVKGIVFRNHGEAVFTGYRFRIRNLDILAFPAFDLLPKLDRYYRVSTQSINGLPSISLITSRGCSGKCVFCDKSVFSDIVTFHSAEYIVALIEKLKKEYGIKSILFEDDNFMAFKPRLKKFVGLLKEKRLKISWSALSRIDAIDKDTLVTAKDGGCWQIQYGIESGSQEILNFYRKGISVEQIKQALDLTRKEGIKTKGLFMLGNPLETQVSIEQSRRLIGEAFLDDVTVTFFTPYPGAAIWNEANSYGDFPAPSENWAKMNWQRMSCYDAVFIPKGLTREYLVSSQKKLLKYFYARPKTVFSYIIRIKSLAVFKELFLSLLALLAHFFTNEKNNCECR